MRRLTNEDGAVAVTTALVVAVLIGMLALVADAGAVYAERRELQNGADAAALAIAEDCARGLVTKCASAASTASSYANDNAHDAASDATLVAFDPTGSVTVRTSTNDGKGGHAILFAFAPVFDLLDGNDHDAAKAKNHGRTVDATATAKWGAVGKLNTLPITASACEYVQKTVNGTVFQQMPIAAGTTGLTYTTLNLQQGNGAGQCAGPAGMDVNGDGAKLPGGFGWLENVDCEVTTTAVGTTDWVTKDEGANPECQEDQLKTRLGTIVQVPIYGDFCSHSGKNPPSPCSTSGKDMYEVVTYSGFYLTAVKFPSISLAAPGWSPPTCTGSCIQGFFVKDVTTGTPTGGNTPGGIVSISLVS